MIHRSRQARAALLVVGLALTLVVGATGQSARAELVTFTTTGSSLHTFFTSPNEITMQFIGAGPTTLDLQPGVPTVAVINNLSLSRGAYPGPGQPEQQTAFFTFNVGTKSVPMTQVMEARWINNNTSSQATLAADPVLITLDSGSRLQITPVRVVGQAGPNTTGGSITKAEFLLLSPEFIAIDIKPGSDPNCFNNDGNGVIPVAILGSADFDVTEVDAGTVALEGMAVKAVGNSNKLLAHIQDVNADGFNDLVVQIEDVDGVFAAGDATATLTGDLLPAFGSTAIEGTDTICIVSAPGGGAAALSPTLFVRGDCDGDGRASGSVTDAVFLLTYNFMGGAEPPCMAACDANGDGQVSRSATDAVYMLAFSFLGGPALPSPFPACGPPYFASDSALGCEAPPDACQ